jgi:hypothetical protein
MTVKELGGRSKADYMKVSVKVGRWMELARNDGQWQTLFSIAPEIGSFMARTCPNIFVI